tara:strand:- start:2448 stop:2657 length:210 start_codon:yes stop_codon:yes gene_type:complete
MNNNQELWKLTSIKLLSEVYQSFKQQLRENDMTLQKLVNRSMYLFMHDKDFREKVSSESYLKNNFKQGY